MIDFFEEYGWTALQTIGGVLGIGLFFSLLDNNGIYVSMLKTVIGRLI